MFVFNVHAQALADRQGYIRYEVARGSIGGVIMDDFDLARQLYFELLRAGVVEPVVIHRKNFKGGHMDNLCNHLTRTNDNQAVTDKQMRDAALAVINWYGEEIDAGFWCYADNESSFTRKNIDFWTEVVWQAQARGGKMVVGNLFVGHPEQHQIAMADPLIRRLTEGEGALGLHEGGFNEWHWKEGWNHQERHGWHTGRYWWWLERQKAIYAGKPPRPLPIAITEFTWEYPRLGLRGPREMSPHWARQGHEPERYMMEQLVEAIEGTGGIPGYLDSGAVMLVAMFCKGQVAARRSDGTLDTDYWGPYNADQFPQFLAMNANYRWPRTILPAPGGPMSRQGLHEISGASVRVRIHPGGTDTGRVLRPDDIVNLNGITREAVLPDDGRRYVWAQMTDSAWFASDVDGLVLTPVHDTAHVNVRMNGVEYEGDVPRRLVEAT